MCLPIFSYTDTYWRLSTYVYFLFFEKLCYLNFLLYTNVETLVAYKLYVYMAVGFRKTKEQNNFPFFFIFNIFFTARSDYEAMSDVDPRCPSCTPNSQCHIYLRRFWCVCNPGYFARNGVCNRKK